MSATATPASGSVARIGLALVAVIALTVMAHFMFGGAGELAPSRATAAAGPSGLPSATPPSTAEPIPTELPPGAIVNFPWLATYDDGLPARWTCGPIGYRLVTDGAPTGAHELLTQAVARIGAVSGLQFREDASVASDSAYPGISVSWVDRPELGTSDSATIGIGGASETNGRYTTGYVKIARDWSGSSRPDFGPESAGPVLLHELGHPLGLSHTEDPKAIMYPSDQGISDWTPAERAALQYLHQTC